MKLGFRQSWNWGLEVHGTLSLSPFKFMNQPHFSMNTCPLWGSKVVNYLEFTFYSSHYQTKAN